MMEQFVPSVGLSARVVDFGVGEALPPVRLRRFAYLPLSAGERFTRDLDLPPRYPTDARSSWTTNLLPLSR